jgi:hypothetical protein
VEDRVIKMNENIHQQLKMDLHSCTYFSDNEVREERFKLATQLG